METIADWLAGLGLSAYAAEFARNDIDLDVLPSLTEQDLAALGVSMGHRKRMLAALAAARGAPPAEPGRDLPGAADQAADAGERRQLTVMFCDLVGSTALAERLDPEDLRAIIRAYQQCAANVIERFDGHVAQFLGDGLLVYFGHPQAHEDDAERAVRAALGIVAAMRALVEHPPFTPDAPLAVRIGIHTGVIVIGDVGTGAQREQLALGDTPNIAARLQSLAQPDTIAISDHTQRLVAGRFQFGDLGLQSIKGIREPLRVWTVTGTSDATSRFQAATRAELTPFVGREEERAIIDGRWDCAVRGEGQVVLLSGEAGIGKSRILEEVRQRLDRTGVRALRFQCSPYHIDSAFYPIATEFARVLGFQSHEPDASKLDRLGALVMGTLGVSAADAALFASVLSLDADSRHHTTTLPTPRQKRDSIRALVGLVERLAGRSPTLLLFEDAHWADPSSLEVLSELIARVATMPALLVVTYRPEFHAEWTGAHVVARSLARLNHAESAALVARVTGHKPLPPGLLEQIVGKADGVPLFVEELTKFLLESEALHETAGGYEYAALSSQPTIPATLRDSLMARLDRVAPVKEIAQIGSAIGREFSYEMIAAVANMPQDRLDGALAALTESGLAQQHRGEPDAAYSFKHALVQETAYESLLKGRRQELHRAIARVLEERYPAFRDSDPGLFAHHLSAAGNAEGAIPYWQQAANLSLRRMALSEAASQLGRGLELVASLPPSVERDRRELPFHALLGTTYMLSKGWGAAEVASAHGRASELSKSVESAEETIWPLWGVWVFHLVRGEMRRAEEIAERIAAVAQASGGRTPQLVAHMMLTQVHMYSGRFEEASRHVARGESFYRQGEDRSLIGLYSTDLLLTLQVHQAHLLWLRGRPDQALALCEAKDDFARSLEHPYSMSWALTWGALPHLYRGDTERLLANVDRGIRIAEEFGFAYTAAIGVMARGWGEAQLGQLESGIARMRTGLDAFRATGSAIVVPFFQTMLAELLGRAGRKPEALELLGQAHAQVEAWGERWQESEIHRVRGVVLLAGPDPDPVGAERSLRLAVDIATAQRAPGWALRATLALARLLRGQGRDAPARELLAPVLASFEEGFDTADVRAAREFLLTPPPPA